MLNSRFREQKRSRTLTDGIQPPLSVLTCHIIGIPGLIGSSLQCIVQ